MSRNRDNGTTGIVLKDLESGNYVQSLRYNWNNANPYATANWTGNLREAMFWKNRGADVAYFRRCVRYLCSHDASMTRLTVMEVELREVIGQPLLKYLPTRTRNMVYAKMDPVDIVRMKQDK